MSNKFVALLLVVCLVTVEGHNISIKYGEKVVSPEDCFIYCTTASVLPKFIKNPLCKWRCDSFVMWESYDGSFARRHGPEVDAPSSVAPAPIGQIGFE
ncbi:unnamed protein product [Lathyrus sativus]|nr:unnamed protein product [Lathyrus sativus]